MPKYLSISVICGKLNRTKTHIHDERMNEKNIFLLQPTKVSLLALLSLAFGSGTNQWYNPKHPKEDDCERMVKKDTKQRDTDFRALLD